MADPAATMRVDRFLWWARLARTRDGAQAIAEQGHCRIDGRRIERAHCPVRIGNVLTYAANGQVRVLRVDALPHRRGPAPEAQGLLYRSGRCERLAAVALRLTRAAPPHSSVRAEGVPFE